MMTLERRLINLFKEDLGLTIKVNLKKKKKLTQLRSDVPTGAYFEYNTVEPDICTITIQRDSDDIEKAIYISHELRHIYQIKQNWLSAEEDEQTGELVYYWKGKKAGKRVAYAERDCYKYEKSAIDLAVHKGLIKL